MKNREKFKREFENLGTTITKTATSSTFSGAVDIPLPVLMDSDSSHFVTLKQCSSTHNFPLKSIKHGDHHPERCGQSSGSPVIHDAPPHQEATDVILPKDHELMRRLASNSPSVLKQWPATNLKEQQFQLSSPSDFSGHSPTSKAVSWKQNLFCNTSGDDGRSPSQEIDCSFSVGVAAIKKCPSQGEPKQREEQEKEGRRCRTDTQKRKIQLRAKCREKKEGGVENAASACDFVGLEDLVRNSHHDSSEIISIRKMKKMSSSSFPSASFTFNWKFSFFRVLILVLFMSAGCSAVFTQEPSDDMPHQGWVLQPLNNRRK